MFGIVFSAINAVLGPLLTAVFIKAMIFTGLAAVVVFVISGLTAAKILPDVNIVLAGLGSWSSFALYLLQLFRLDIGIPLCFSAIATRFIIRRIPLIG